MPYDKLFPKSIGSVKIGTVATIENTPHGNGGAVVLQDGERISYDVLILATGSKWVGPPAFPDDDVLCQEHIQNWRNKFRNAQDVVIVGGGAVGIG